MSLKSAKDFNYTDDFENTSNIHANQLASKSKRNDKPTQGGLSSNELKKKLIQVVKNKGIYDLMKSQVRNKLVFELNPNLENIKTKAAENSELNIKIKSNLALTTINCLLIDHLKSNEYDYTLSVFMPECGINLNEAYSLTDVLHILKVSPESKLYAELTNSAIIKSKGLLWYLVNYFCKHYVTHDAGMQTDQDGVHNIASNLDFKLKNLDIHYGRMSENFNNKLSFEEKVIVYQKQLEEKSKQELEQKLKEFKDIELTRMRLEEREKQRTEMHAYRLELEHTYKKRSDALKHREKTLEEILKQKNQADEREVYLQRQHLLEEVKQLRDKELDQRRSMESQLKIVQLDSDRFERMEEDLRKRELQLKQSEKDMESKLRDERERIKLDLERIYAEREFILQSIDIKNKQDASNNELEKAHLERMKREFQDQQMRLNELDLQFQRAESEATCLRQENELLKEKLSHCLDYDFIKQENRMLKYKLDISKELIGEKSIIASGRNKNRLSRLNNDTKVSMSVNPPQIPNGSQQYVPQRKRSVTFASDAPDHILSQLNLKVANSGNNNNYNIDNLEENSVMLATEMGADEDVLPEEANAVVPNEDQNRTSYLDEGDRILENTVERSVIKDNLEHYNVVNNELRDLYEMQIFEQRKLHDTVNDVKKQVEFLFNGAMLDDMESKKLGQQRMFSSAVDSEAIKSSVGFIDSAKDRLKYLERESERIEQSYLDYQHKIKSKYYPINDDDENELKVVHTKKRDVNHQLTVDIEKFLESTLKANAKAKQMRNELEADMAKQERVQKDKYIGQDKIASLKSVEDLIRTVSMPVVTEYNAKLDTSLIKEQLMHDQTEFSTFQAKQRSSSSPPPKSSKNYSLKNNYLNDDSSNGESNSDSAKKKSNERVVKAMNTTLSDSKPSSPRVSRSRPDSPKKNSGGFLVDDYVKMFDGSSKQPSSPPKKNASHTENEERNEEREKPPKIKHIKIEYSSSTGNSDNDDKSGDSKNKEYKLEHAKNDDDDDDDFNW